MLHSTKTKPCQRLEKYDKKAIKPVITMASNPETLPQRMHKHCALCKLPTHFDCLSDPSDQCDEAKIYTFYPFQQTGIVHHSYNMATIKTSDHNYNCIIAFTKNKVAEYFQYRAHRARSVTVWKRIPNPSKMRSFRLATCPTPAKTLMASRACKEPIMPGMTPSTPASEQREQLSGFGATGNRQR